MAPLRSLIPLIVAALLLLAGAATAEAPPGTLSQDPSDRLSTVPHDPQMQTAIRESAIDRIVVLHEGWRETLPTFARLKIHEVTGRTSLSGQYPSYTVLSMIYEPERWYDARVIPVEHPKLLEALSLKDKWVSPRMIIESPGLQPLIEELSTGGNLRSEAERLTKLMNAVEQVHRLGTEMRVLSAFEADGIKADQLLEIYNDKDKLNATHKDRQAAQRRWEERKPYQEAAERLLSRAKSISLLQDQLLVVPDTESVDNRWIRPVAFGGSGGGSVPLVDAGRQFNAAMQQAFLTSNPTLISKAVDDFLGVVERSREYPSRTYRDVQNFYVTQNPWRVAAWVYLVGSMLCGLYFFFGGKAFYRLAVGLMVLGFISHTTAVGTRMYLTGHAPVSNMFESITFCSWAVMLFAMGFEAWSRRGLVMLGSMIVGFLLLTGAGLMPLHQTRLHPLRAVLNSYWLNIHVTMMLLSYAAFAIAAFFASLYLIRSYLGREALFGGTPVMTQAQTEEFAYRLVQVGWPILTFGVTLGAVWADTAWGRYWGWDPKETWAFITWVTYTFYLHSRMVMGWRGRWSAFACVTGWIMVMITWWGVSYLPWFAGGLHSYASPN